MEMDLDIILPIYNPREGWHHQLKKSDEYWHKTMPGVNIQYLLVDDGSPEPQPLSVLQELAELNGKLRYLRYEENGGKGKAVKHGATASTAAVLIYTDHDIPYQDEFVPSFYEAVRSGSSDLVLCYRDDSYYNQAPLIRRIISQFLKSMIRFFVRIPTTDTQGGLKALSPSARQALVDTKTDSYLFDLELVKLAHSRKLTIENKPVVIREGLVFSKMGAKLLFKELGAFVRIVFS